MKLDNQFTIGAPASDVWSAMLDLERVAACVPGSEVIGATDDGALEANIRVKVEPMTMNYRGVVTIVERDHANQRAVLKAKARETKGQGSATAEMIIDVRDTQPVEVSITTNLEVTGRVAQMGRGIMQDVAGRLIAGFAEGLRAMIAGQGAASAPQAQSSPPPSATVPEGSARGSG
ncbi:MAG: SRPBCC family protein [Solirubrobacteraceae bacterium]